MSKDPSPDLPPEEPLAAQADAARSTNGMARGMVIGAWVLLLALLTGLFGKWVDHAENPNQHPVHSSSADGINEVLLERNHYGHYVTNGLINGQEVQFMLDTGATDVVVPEQLAQQLGLKKGVDGMALTANGSVRVFSTRLRSLEIGSIALHNVRASINPGMKDMEILLGMSALRDLEFIQRGSTLTIRQYP